MIYLLRFSFHQSSKGSQVQGDQRHNGLGDGEWVEQGRAPALTAEGCGGRSLQKDLQRDVTTGVSGCEGEVRLLTRPLHGWL